MANCVIEFKLYTEKWQEDVLAHVFRCSERMYNTLVRHALLKLSEMECDFHYQRLLVDYRRLSNMAPLSRDESKKLKEVTNKLKELRLKYELSEYQFHSYIVKMKNESFGGVIDINTAQKIASAVWKSVSDYIFGNGKYVHFKKRGTLSSIEGKSNKSGIIFKSKDNVLQFKGMKIPIKVRKNDNYAKAMLEHRICYCRIVRKPFKNGYKYFVQLILEGEPVKVPEIGKGNVGIDQGPSTIAAVGDSSALLKAHGITNTKTFQDYNKEINKYAKQLERSLRINNPSNYNGDGTIKKGIKKWIRSKCYYKTLFKLKDAYRRKTAFIQQEHNKTANQILKMGDRFITEPMNWKALQKRSKKTERSDKASTVIKNGDVKTIHKYKRKKRYGKSLNNHSPGYLQKRIVTKLAQNDKKLEFVQLSTYRASQYNPDTNTYEKSGLNDRAKTIHGQLIQRDLLSAYLQQNPNSDLSEIDIENVKCNLEHFIKLHNECINAFNDIRNLPSCMGLKAFTH